MTAPKKGNGRAKEAVVLGDRYRLEAQVATGGMGEVWRATDTLLERTVAVKLLRESLAEDPVLSERFRREALMAARLSHPNMADVFDYVQDDARPGIVMEYVDGETLAERIAREGALSVADAVRITSALLAVLQVAHDQGVVHRDVKPGNVMLPPADGVKVTDFGIARATGHETITETGMVVGTAHYLSPEQVSGKPARPESDIYSAGAILYEMLTGKKPFEAETPLA
ncbi:MAG: serine/threonine-protein kinase, partial [Actinomycetota bacterium]